MSHYDCTNCGAYGGIAIGICKECTPPEYFRLEERLKVIRKEIKTKVDEATRSYIDEMNETVKKEYETELAVITETMKRLEKRK